MEKNLLPHKFYTNPKTAQTIKTAIGIACIFDQTEGFIFAKGKTWEIKVEDVGANNYRVYLKEAGHEDKRRN